MVIRKSALTASKWSGGTTTELFIYPENSSYTTRDFDFRISTATVETDRSEFTHLPDYQRILLVLSGQLTMEYQTDTGTPASIVLSPLEQASFPGSRKITGLGKVTDFNIIYKPEYQASAETIRCSKQEEVKWEMKEDYCFIWVVEGELLTSSGSCKAEELLVVESNERTIIRAMANSTIILIRLRRDILAGNN